MNASDISSGSDAKSYGNSSPNRGSEIDTFVLTDSK